MRISISFTADEIDWLNWVVTDVLKNSELDTHSAAKKILDAQTLLKDVTNALEETGKVPEEEDKTKAN